jgi:hypothetical protein
MSSPLTQARLSQRVQRPRDFLIIPKLMAPVTHCTRTAMRDGRVPSWSAATLPSARCGGHAARDCVQRHTFIRGAIYTSSDP